MSDVYDSRRCELGEGPLWHSGRNQLFWFDILSRRLLSRDGGRVLSWQFEEYCSAAAVLDQETLLIASESGLYRFDIESGHRTLICALEAHNSATRSNDGKADPWGGFWIGMMGKQAENGAGAIYRFFEGCLHPVFENLTIPNSLCFSPDRKYAYWSDTPTHKIMRQPLDSNGWPQGHGEVFVDLGKESLNPDGSTVDSAGALWNAQWGAGRVVRYLPDGSFDRKIDIAGQHTSCPAFGGEKLQTLFVTTACEGIKSPDELQGLTYCQDVSIQGIAEYRVIL